jgi:hypothetical protein
MAFRARILVRNMNVFQHTTLAVASKTASRRVGVLKGRLEYTVSLLVKQVNRIFDYRRRQPAAAVGPLGRTCLEAGRCTPFAYRDMA